MPVTSYRAYVSYYPVCPPSSQTRNPSLTCCTTDGCAVAPLPANRPSGPSTSAGEVPTAAYLCKPTHPSVLSAHQLQQIKCRQLERLPVLHRVRVCEPAATSDPVMGTSLEVEQGGGVRAPKVRVQNSCKAPSGQHSLAVSTHPNLSEGAKRVWCLLKAKRWIQRWVEKLDARYPKSTHSMRASAVNRASRLLPLTEPGSRNLVKA